MKKNRLMQLFQNNANVPREPIAIKVEATGEDESTIYLYDAIGDWFGVSAKEFVKELTAIKSGTIHLRINSPGGDVFEARTIATAISQCGKKVKSHIDGVCASAATYVALAASEVEMAQGSFFMIHNAWTMTYGNAEEMRSTAALLDQIDASIVTDYAKKTGKGKEEIGAMMAAETWLTADDALAAGFIDSVYDGDKVENKWNLSAYENVPEKLAKTTQTVYDREKFEKRLQLIEAIA